MIISLNYTWIYLSIEIFENRIAFRFLSWSCLSWKNLKCCRRIQVLGCGSRFYGVTTADRYVIYQDNPRDRRDISVETRILYFKSVHKLHKHEHSMDWVLSTVLLYSNNLYVKSTAENSYVHKIKTTYCFLICFHHLSY